VQCERLEGNKEVDVRTQRLRIERSNPSNRLARCRVPAGLCQAVDGSGASIDADFLGGTHIAARNMRTRAKEIRMKPCNASPDRASRLLAPIACITALAMTLAISWAHSAPAGEIAVPPVPEKIRGLAPNTPYRVAHALGTQDYVYLPAGRGFRFVLFTPEATLFDERGHQMITHFFSPNPNEGGRVRPTWQSRDASRVWGAVGPGDSSSEAAFIKPRAIPWLKVTVVGKQAGTAGEDPLTQTTIIQRLNTVGGPAPSTGCAVPSDVGHEAFVPYTADYFFYKEKAPDR